MDVGCLLMNLSLSRLVLTGNDVSSFQESYLSRRALYFTDDQVYFRCRESSWSENYVNRLPEPNNDEFHATPLPIAWKANPESEYRLILFYYTSRGLTNQADALLAMAGIIWRL